MKGKNFRRIIRQKKKGFTLIEMLVVLIIIGLLISISIPASKAILERAKKVTEQAEIRNQEIAAMAAALTSGMDSGTFTPNDGTAFSNAMNELLGGADKWNQAIISNGNLERIQFSTPNGDVWKDMGTPVNVDLEGFHEGNLPTPPPGPTPPPQPATPGGNPAP